MEQNRKRTRRSSSRASRVNPLTFMSETEFAELGDGRIAYIRELTNAQARRLFPTVEGLPRGINLYALHGADGTPIALTDSRQAAIGHAVEGELEIASVH